MFEYKEYILFFKDKDALQDALMVINSFCDEQMIILVSGKSLQISTDLSKEELDELGEELFFKTMNDRNLLFPLFKYNHKETLDDILDKILDCGIDSLTHKEFRSLNRISGKI